MTFDLAELGTALGRRPRVARIVVAEVKGSAPREAGTAMLVWPGGQSGTIGGGALEWQATQTALAMIAGVQRARVSRLPLGPALGQCCGGAVTLVTEVFDAAHPPLPEGDLFARPVAPDAAPDMPLAMVRVAARARREGDLQPLLFADGWLAEPGAAARIPLWIWGAGHVGRALVQTIAPLPDFAISWADSDMARFPDAIPEGVTPLIAENPADLVPLAPAGAAHLILTFSHALDLELCHRLLRHGFSRCGLIGSASKWARFRSRLAALGHDDAQILRIACPIGDPGLGKHPQAIAVGVAAALLREVKAASGTTGEIPNASPAPLRIGE